MMIRKREVVIEVALGRLGPLILLSVLVGLLTLNTVARAEPSQMTANTASSWAESFPGRYYLTRNNHYGDEAPTACADGYHMASLWEIIDTSNLIYDTNLRKIAADSGNGPPAGSWASGFYGCVRTGGTADGSLTPGKGNCQAWTINSGLDFGTLVGLPNDWTASTEIGIWKAATYECNITFPV